MPGTGYQDPCPGMDTRTRVLGTGTRVDLNTLAGPGTTSSSTTVPVPVPVCPRVGNTRCHGCPGYRLNSTI
eukprot:1953587-Rhodomonas_salina.6